VKQTTDYSKYLIPAAVVVGGYFVLKNFGLFGSGNAGAANSNAITSGNAASVQASLNAAAASGDFPTISAAGAQGLADSIYNAGVSSPVNMDAIQQNIIAANTLTDLLMIVKAFGTKQAGGLACSIFGGFLSNTCGTYDLNSWVRENLDQSHINSINQYLGMQGINYSF
jgi:hypothetical protein